MLLYGVSDHGRPAYGILEPRIPVYGFFVRGLHDSCMEGRSDIQGSFIFDPGPTLLNLCDSLSTLDTFAPHPTDVIMCTLPHMSNDTLEPFYGYTRHPEESSTAEGIQDLIEGSNGLVTTCYTSCTIFVVTNRKKGFLE